MDADTIENQQGEIREELPTGGLLDSGGNPLTDIEAERLLLGFMLADITAYDRVQQEVGEGDFSDPFHQRMFATFARGAEEGWTVDAPAIIAALGGDPKAIIVGKLTAAQYMARLIVDADMSLDPGEIAAHIQTVAERRAVGTIDDAEWQANEVFRSTMGLKMWAEQDEPAAEYEYIVEDLIPQQEGVLLIGETQTGKSFLTYHLGMCIARAVPFFGRRILKPMGVVWAAYEAGRGAGARMRAYRRHHGLELEDLPFGVLQEPIRLWPDETSVDKLIAEIKGIARSRFNGVPLGAVIIDTHNAGTPGASEIDSEVTSKIREKYHRIIAETGATLIIVGHTNSAGKHRGNEQLTNNIDTIIKVALKTTNVGKDVFTRKDEDGREMRFMKVLKQREGRSGDEHEFVLREVEDGTINRYGKPRTSCVIAAPNISDVGNDDQPKSRFEDGQQGVRPSKQEKLFIECLLQSIDDFGVLPPPELGLPKTLGKVVEYDRVKRLLSTKLLREDDNTEEGQKAHRNRMKTALRRHREQMMHLKVIGCHDPYIWWTGKPVIGIARTQPKQSRDMFEDIPPAGGIEDFM